MFRINKLTSQQEVTLEEYRLSALEAGYSTQAINRKDIEQAVAFFYRTINKPTPAIFYSWSPLGNCIFPILVKNLGDNLWDNLWANLWANLRDNLGANLGDNWHWGAHELGWITFYCFCNAIGVPYTAQNMEKLVWHNKYARSALWMNAYENICFVCERPIEIHTKPLNRQRLNILHKDGDMAIKFKDGYGLYMLNGIRMPKEIVMTPAHELDPALILTETNAEIRREIVRKIGIERIIQRLHGKIIDSWGDYELIVLKVPNMGITPTYLKMRNPSIGVWHLEGVPPYIKTCRGALSWRIGGIEWNPEQLT